MKTMRSSLFLSLLLALTLLSSCMNGTPNSSSSKPGIKQPTAVPVPASAEASNATASDAPAYPSKEKVYPFHDHPTVNVYLETSGSMNGYVNGGTSKFQQVVKEYLSGINNANFAGQVNYFYINSQIIKRGQDLNQYITRLTPQSFASAGNTGTTDIGALFKTILSKTDNNTISVFISDCIISPGNNTNTEAYLRGQMTDVRDAVVSYVNQYNDLACLVYQINSEFNGTYYDYQNTPHRNVRMERPFYIWVFGHTCHVSLLKLNYVPDRDFAVAPIRNEWMIFNTPLKAFETDFTEVKYGLLLPNTPSIGKYNRVDAKTLKAIQRPSPADNYRFTFGADMTTAEALMSKEYIEDTNNYIHVVSRTTKQKFFGRIESVFDSRSPYTEHFVVESENPIPRGEFNLAFIPNVPKWAVSCTDYDDRSFNGSNDDKTYGLEFIFRGIVNGYNVGGNDNILAEFNFEIK